MSVRYCSLVWSKLLMGWMRSRTSLEIPASLTYRARISGSETGRKPWQCEAMTVFALTMIRAERRRGPEGHERHPEESVPCSPFGPIGSGTSQDDDLGLERAACSKAGEDGSY